MNGRDLASETAVKLIESATALFNDFGYSGTSINDIAKKAELSKGILYHYFSNKDEVYLFCLKKCINDFIASMEQNIPKASLNKNSLLMLVELRFIFFDENPQYKNLFHNTISSNPAHLTKEIAKIRQLLIESNVNWIKMILNEIALGKNVLESDIILFVTILQNSSTFLLDSKGDQKQRKDVINSVVRLTTIFLNGLNEDLI